MLRLLQLAGAEARPTFGFGGTTEVVPFYKAFSGEFSASLELVPCDEASFNEFFRSLCSPLCPRWNL